MEEMAIDTISHEGDEQIPPSHDKASMDQTLVFVSSKKSLFHAVLTNAAAKQSLDGGQITVIAGGEVQRKELEHQTKNLNMLKTNVCFLSHHDAKHLPLSAVPSLSDVQRATVVLDESEDADESEQPLGRIVLRKFMKLVDHVPRFQRDIVHHFIATGGVVRFLEVKDELARLVVQCVLQPDILQSVTESLGLDEGIFLSPPKHRFLSRPPWQSSGIEGSPDQTGYRREIFTPRKLEKVPDLADPFSRLPWPSRGSRGVNLSSLSSIKAWVKEETKGTNLRKVSLLSKSIWRTIQGVLNLANVHRANLLAIASFSFMSVVEAMAPEAATAQGTLAAGEFEKSSTIGFGVVGVIGVTLTGLGVLVAVKEFRRRNAALGAPGGGVLNRAGRILVNEVRRLSLCGALLLNYEHERRAEEQV